MPGGQQKEEIHLDLLQTSLNTIKNYPKQLLLPLERYPEHL